MSIPPCLFSYTWLCTLVVMIPHWIIISVVNWSPSWLRFHPMSNFSASVSVGGTTALRAHCAPQRMYHWECRSSTQHSGWMHQQCTTLPHFHTSTLPHFHTATACRGKCLAPSCAPPGGWGAGGRQAYLITTRVTSVLPASPRVPRSSPP